MEVFPSVPGCSTGHVDVYGMLPVSLTMSWCATWFALSRNGGMVVVGSFDSLLLLLSTHISMLVWRCPSIL